MLVTIKPIKNSNREWSAFKGPRYPKSREVLTVFTNSTGKLITGLSKEDEERLGKELDADLRVTSSYWDDFKIVMSDRDLVLDLSYPEDELKYLVLRSHFLIKQNKNQINPYAKYEIYDELEEAKTINTVSETKAKAYMLCGNLSIEERIAILKLYPSYTKINAKTVKPDIINSALYLKIEEDASKFISLVEDKNRESKVLLKDLVDHGILTKNKTAYKYGKDFLGHNEETTIQYLNDPENQSLKITLIQELESKTK